MAVDIQGYLQGYQNSGANEVNANAIGTIGPHVSTLTAPMAATQQYNAASSTPSSQSGLSKFGHFIGGLATNIGHLAVGAASFLEKTAVDMATAAPRFAAGVGHIASDWQQQTALNQRVDQNLGQLKAINASYRAGKISKSIYDRNMHDLNNEMNTTGDNNRALAKRINSDKVAIDKAAVDTAAAVVTVMTSGLGEISFLPTGEKTAAEYLSSVNAKAMMDNVEKGLNTFANDPAAFGKLNPGMQMALQKSSAEIIAGARGSMTSGEIARAAATNLALKYPLYYSYMSSTGHQIFNELDQAKYGAAVRSVAFNSLLLLSGGPIGQALKYGSRAIGGLAARTFEATPFITELSKGTGDGNPLGYVNALVHGKDFSNYRFFDNGKIVTLSNDQAQVRIAQNLRAIEKTNLGAVGGNDKVAAAWRVLDGMASYEGISMKSFSHDEALLNMSNFAEAQRAADFYGQKAGLGGVTVGRISKINIMEAAKQLATTNSKGEANKMLDNLIANNSKQAWANNTNYITQVKALIKKYGPGEDLTNAMGNIKASFTAKGFPESVAKELGEIGYLPIQPAKLEAPFREGANSKMEADIGKLGEENQFFKKAVQPMPVLSSIGTLFTGMGLSPMASESRLNAIYNAAVGERLNGMALMNDPKLKGDTSEHTIDNVLKSLRDWTNKLNSGQIKRGGVKLAGQNIRPPIQDIKQLMTKDIAAALNISNDEARLVGRALRNATLDVPLAVRGLGDRVVDVVSQIPLFRSYLRAQGAGRFAWNPIFQGKLITKTEFAAQGLSGGKAPVILDNILGKGPQIESTRGLLRTAGLLDRTPAKALKEIAAGGEAVNQGDALGANLTHKLLDTQERSIAGMINKMAEKTNMTPAQFVEQFPQETHDTIYMIAQYDRNSSFLHSPLIRTLNIAFFPFRFEYKVASIMAKSLAQTDTLTQVAVINGLMNAHNFLNSPEGMAWYSQNSSVLKFISYFSPTSTISTVSQALSGLSHEDWKTTVGAYDLGGLPFGWIPQILNDEGANFTPGYVDPATGQVLAHNIPNTDKAKLQTAIGDLIGTLFTYPGAEIGLQSKSSIDRFIGGAVTGGKAPKTDFTPTQPYLNAQQQKYSQTIQSTPKNAQQNQPQGPTQIPSSTKIPIESSGTAAPVYKSGGPKAAKTPKLKKGQFKASLPS